MILSMVQDNYNQKYADDAFCAILIEHQSQCKYNLYGVKSQNTLIGLVLDVLNKNTYVRLV